MNPDDRTLAWLKSLKWKGGTIHQIAIELGCPVDSLLYSGLELIYYPATDSYMPSSDFQRGYTEAYNPSFISEKGNTDYWLGVASRINSEVEHDC